MSKKKNSKKQEPVAAGDVQVDIHSIPMFSKLADQICGPKTDKWIKSEVVVFLMDLCGHLESNWTDIARIAAKADGMSVSFAVKTTRASTPPTIKVTGSYSEKHPMKSERDGPDLEQLDLLQELPPEKEGAPEPETEQL